MTNLEDLDNMSMDELIDLTVQLYDAAKAKIDAGEGNPELMRAANEARQALKSITSKKEQH